MSYLIDTNILLRSVEPLHPMFEVTTRAVEILFNRDEQLYITSQNLIEFWNVCTRPKDKNGLGFSIAETQQEVIKIKDLFQFLSDKAGIYVEWERLVNSYQVKGVNVHDARLVAVMLNYQITHILTFNTRDFKRYPEIIPINPQEFELLK